jgi:hypothetical protein
MRCDFHQTTKRESAEAPSPDCFEQFATSCEAQRAPRAMPALHAMPRVLRAMQQEPHAMPQALRVMQWELRAMPEHHP